ncbi:MAG: glutathione S-transferase family protein [Polyangia bacterium]
MSIKLYYSPMTRAGRCRWALEELGVPYELVRLDLQKGEHKRPEYLRVHPLGRVPALVDGDLALIESVAICMYLADKYADKGLAPALDDPRRGPYYQWMMFVTATMEAQLTTLVAHTLRLPAEQRVPALADAARSELASAFAYLDDALARGPYLLGDWFTMADVVVGSGMAWAAGMGLLINCPNIQAYVARISQRPALQRSRVD